MRGGALAGTVLFVGLAAAGRSDAGEAPVFARSWAAWSASPLPIDGGRLDSLERTALDRCGTGEAGLGEVARVILERRLRGRPLPGLDALALDQRAAGEPHPWARVWAASAPTLVGEAAMARLDPWLDQLGPARLRRCGVASGATADGTRVLLVVAVDALADLSPLPTRARAGQWLTVEARMRVRAHGGTVVVLGPSGSPRTVPTSFDGTTLRARFAPDRAGEFSVQVVADLAGGPRPVLEATVFAGVEPPATDDSRAAPGEDAGAGSDEDRLTAMLTAARGSAGMRPLARDARLDKLARDHALRMVRVQELAHDAGDGDPLGRLRAAGLDARDAGENVARAATLALAHRALWASPSHRANLLRAEFDRVGVAVVRDEHGDAWTVETFAGGLR